MSSSKNSFSILVNILKAVKYLHMASASTGVTQLLTNIHKVMSNLKNVTKLLPTGSTSQSINMLITQLRNRISRLSASNISTFKKHDLPQYILLLALLYHHFESAHAVTTTTSTQLDKVLSTQLL